jgi:hypothetical protein
MICVRLEGGLGNQMFQYAAGRSLAIKHNTNLLLDVSSLGKRNRVTHREYELDCFGHKGIIASKNQVKSIPRARILAPFSKLIGPWTAYVEKKSGFNEVFEQLPDQSYLIGFWQSCRYFSSAAVDVCNDFARTKDLSSKSKLVLEKISILHSSVSMHIRRGDYISSPKAASHHGSLDLNFYRTAIENISHKIGQPNFFIFSDDIAWCRENFSYLKNVSFVDHNYGRDSWQDIILMSHCKHSIIANSSFSWWAAWMGDQRYNKSSRIVIAPNRWFLTKNNSSLIDRFPSSWTLI